MSNGFHDDLPDVRLSSAQAVRLVAGREINTRLRSKSYQIITAALMLMVLVFSVVMQMVTSGDDVQKVGFTAASAPLAQRLETLADVAGVEVDTVSVDGEQAGRDQVADGSLDALLLQRQGTQVPVVVEEELDETLQASITQAAGQVTLDQEITRLGGDPSVVARQVAETSVQVDAIDPPQDFDPQRLAVGSIAGILIYLALIATGASVAQGVVEEKSSRVVELLLATVHPWQLMAGKVVGIGVVGLLQVVLVGATGVLAGQLTGALSLSWATTIGSAVWLVVWFVLGFTLYSLVFAGLGALVSRQEDVGGVTTPATMLLVVGYVVGISVLPNSPDNTVVGIMSLLPVFSPTLMPMRLAMGAVPLWQTVTALALAVAAVPLLVALTGRIYRNGVVRTGARVRLRDALR
ncbi:MAG TPA: ABC transporter permease [Nocardioidaceae bacterium]|nr:ABC transporter permease [Nocardioidaceae bacterium]